jgi:hypothetical protein
MEEKLNRIAERKHRNLPILGSFSAGRLKNLPYSPPPGLGRLVKILLKACLVAEANTRNK